jgi:hypothetical protein
MCRCWHRCWAPHALIPSNNQELEEAVLLTVLSESEVWSIIRTCVFFLCRMCCVVVLKLLTCVL